MDSSLSCQLYYLRTQPSTVPTAVTVPVKRATTKEKEKGKGKKDKDVEVVCNDDVCVSCSG